MKIILTLILSVYVQLTFSAENYLEKRLQSTTKFPRVEILNEDTPIERLENLENYLRSEEILGKLWVKRDDQSNKALGGNKARKLEYLIGEMLDKGIKTVSTSGMWGSNHAYSTAIAAKNFGLDVELLLGPQPVTENVKKKLLANYTLGAELNYFSSQLTLGIGILRSWVKSVFNKEFYFVPPGGTTPLSGAGYVNAFLEMLSQFKDNELPKRIILPMGTAGTSAGLLVGRCLAGLEDEMDIIAVGISHGALSNKTLLLKTAKKLEKFIRKSLSEEEKETFPACKFKLNNGLINYVSDYSAPGYGEASEEVLETIKLIEKLEQITLDQTYSAKAFLYLMDLIKSEMDSGVAIKKTLFWHTYNSFDLNKFIEAYPWKNPASPQEDLPVEFHSIF